MQNITFITGGARSGKSSYGQGLAEKDSANPVYLATARIWDEDFKERIDRHKADRGPEWTTIEEEKNLSKLDLKGKTVLMDCVTLWLTNIFFDQAFDLNKSLEVAKEEWNRFIQQDFNLIVVSNEIGMGVHPEHKSARKFADLQGFMNQYIAASAQSAFLMVSGIPMKLK